MKLTRTQVKKIEERHNEFQDYTFQDGMTDVLDYLDVDYHIVKKGYERYLKIENVQEDAE